ncbi:hypothetical protein D3C71_1278270 [compost metagenome]
MQTEDANYEGGLGMSWIVTIKKTHMSIDAENAEVARVKGKERLLELLESGLIELEVRQLEK